MNTASPDAERLKALIRAAPQGLKARLAERVLSEGICGAHQVQAALLPLALSKQPSAGREAARAMLAQCGCESASAAFQSLVQSGRIGLDSLSDFMQMMMALKPQDRPADQKALLSSIPPESLAELAEHASCSEALVRVVAVKCALMGLDALEREYSRKLIASLGLESAPAAFQSLVSAGELHLEHLEQYLGILFDIKSGLTASPPQPAQSHLPAPPALSAPQAPVARSIPLAEALPPSAAILSPLSEALADAAAAEGLKEAAAPETLRSTDFEEEDGTPLQDAAGREHGKRQSERPPLEPYAGAEELRKADIRGKALSAQDMYRLICIECFRLASGKPLIDKQYAPLNLVQSNLTKRMRGDSRLHRLFEKCWARMASAGAISVKKNGDVASLNHCTRDIADPEVQAAVEWSLSENRRIRNGTQTRNGSS